MVHQMKSKFEGVQTRRSILLYGIKNIVDDSFELTNCAAIDGEDGSLVVQLYSFKLANFAYGRKEDYILLICTLRR
ncbi:hypothetical protein T07_10803 [Trichinella nelsoni]|uniref:Uncharacterized protein n=1 Tax=Trichinella nelsoni TaxID=6336 RepID=A0A0V0S6P7_9BILA|nr:hypothetical protein T07_10803 [Trichinella nelsoni]